MKQLLRIASASGSAAPLRAELVSRVPVASAKIKTFRYEWRLDFMNTNQYTQKTLEALQAAQQLAVEYQHNAIWNLNICCTPSLRRSRA